jgi:hypothetical protein
MPINPNALGDSTGPNDDGEAREAAERQADDDAKQEGQPKRQRRTKAQLIADAVVPGDDETVELKDKDSGAKIERPWLVALEMVRDEKAEFSDKSMKYAMLKHDQQKAASAFAPDEPQEPKSNNVPPEAEVGDEVRIGKDVFRVGHDGVLTNSPVSVNGEIVKPKRTWQRELGTGGKGPWEVVQVHPEAHAPQPTPSANGNDRHDEPKVETVRLPRTEEVLDDGNVKIGTGILEKIGLPDYSSLQVGPLTMSRTVVDDGRRTTVPLSNGREAEVITAAIEGFELLDNTLEFVASRFRGQLQTFLEATGALKQPVS